MSCRRVFVYDPDKPGGQQAKAKENRVKNTGIGQAITSVEDLKNHMNLKAHELPELNQVTKTFPMSITPYYFSLIEDINDENDPIRKQCVPTIAELKDDYIEEVDPLSEEETSPVSCLVHRYPDRALLIVSNKCFMYCRHCTRKRIWKNNLPQPTLKEIEKALEYVKANKQIREIIVSGGDPLRLSTQKIDTILAAVARCENIEAIRIGTRVPVVCPSRIDADLCKVLSKYKNLWINVQFNHPREVTIQSEEACRKLQRCGIPLSNQSVLLKGINDNAKIMMELCHKLQSIRVRPYYLFQCDPVIGTSHFRTPVSKGTEIIEKMRGHTGGMCVPTFVVDGIKGKGKIPLGPNYVVSRTKEGLNLKNYKNEVFFYPSSEEKK
jgi:lysine 2,3-aminomutase